MSKTFKIINRKGNKAKGVKHAKKIGLETTYFCKCEYCKNKREREKLTKIKSLEVQLLEYKIPFY